MPPVLSVPLPPCPAVVPVMWHPSIGMCIGILGFAGIIMPVIRDKMSRPEKIVWIVCYTLLLFLELGAIKLEDIKNGREHDHAQCEEERRFEKITGDLKQNIDTATTVLTTTQGVATTTQGVGKLAKENLENITGKGSFPIVVPGIPASHGPLSGGGPVTEF